jgi:AcrR family transcriptional regulator
VNPNAIRRRGPVNDAPVREAACRVLVEQGWGRFTIARVAAELGRSARTVTERAGSPVELAAQLATSVAAAELLDRCTDLVGAWRLSRDVGDPAPLVRALRRTARWQGSEGARVLAELVVVAHFVDEVGQALAESTRSPLRAMHALPDGDGAVPSLIAMSVGLAMSARAPRAGLLLDVGAFDSYACACVTGDRSVPLPFAPADHMDRVPTLDADPVINALLNQMLSSVGRRGYDGTRIKDVAAEVGVSEGFVFSRYPTKADLLAAALAHHDEAGFALNEAYVRGLEADHGRGVANAVMLRESLRPGREVGRARVLEFARMSWHDAAGAHAARTAADQLRADLLAEPGWAAYETEAEFHLEIAQFVGVLTLPLLLENAVDIPFGDVTVPWDRVRRERS